MYGLQAPPIIALLFENEEAARKIFAGWRERFGPEDVDEVIHLAIIKGISSVNPSHYEVLLTSSLSSQTHSAAEGLTAYVGRHLTVTPETSTNLDHFLDEYQRVETYFLAPAILKNGEANPIRDLAIRKDRLAVRNYGDIEPHDPEAMAFPDTIRRGHSGSSES